MEYNVTLGSETVAVEAADESDAIRIARLKLNIAGDVKHPFAEPASVASERAANKGEEPVDAPLLNPPGDDLPENQLPELSEPIGPIDPSVESNPELAKDSMEQNG